ncbi:hypothetical protein [Rhodococcus koreensis]
MRRTRPSEPPKSSTTRSKLPKWPWGLAGLIVAGLFLGAFAAYLHDSSSRRPAETTAHATALRPRPTLNAEEFQRQEAARTAEAERGRQAEEARRQSERDRIAAIAAAKTYRGTYAILTDRDLALIAKSPDGANVGRKLVVHGQVTQFDSVTGPTSFRASIACQPQNYSFDYDIDAYVNGDNPAVVANVVEDDMVTMYVEVVGSKSYTTTLGGKITVSLFKANIIDVTGSA